MRNQHLLCAKRNVYCGPVDMSRTAAVTDPFVAVSAPFRSDVAHPLPIASAASSLAGTPVAPATRHLATAAIGGAPPSGHRQRPPSVANALAATLAVALATALATAGCTAQVDAPAKQAVQESDIKDAGGVDAEFAVKAFALGVPTIAASSPKNEQTYPIAQGGTVSVDVAYAVSNFTLGQVRCYLDGTFVAQGNATTYKFVGIVKGAHTLSCSLADNTGTELIDVTARFSIIIKAAEPCTLGSDCVDSNACSQEACVDLQCVYGMALACCHSNYNCTVGELCVNPNTSNAKCSTCTLNTDCNDNESCTTDSCDLSGTKGICKNTKLNPDCCSKANDPCDDGKTCTVDSCDVGLGKCKHIQPPDVCCKDADCLTTDPCMVVACVDNECHTGPDVFKPNCCSAGYNTACDDKNFCTIDTCNQPQAGGWVACKHETDATKPNCCEMEFGATNAQCDDKQPCTVDYCDSYACKNLQVKECCQQTIECDDTNPCTIDNCKIDTGAVSGLCKYAKIGDCCTSISDCDDNKYCTVDSCNYAALICKYTKTDPDCCDIDAECNDGKACTINACVNKVCVYSKDITKPNCCDSIADCNDGKPCTTDACNTGTGLCEFVPTGVVGCCNANEDCNDNDCSTQDYCDGFNKCKFTLAIGKCKADIDCDDGKPCTGDKCITLDGCGTCQNDALPATQCCDSDSFCNDQNA